jgi:fatty-acyl-CoA synthase
MSGNYGLGSWPARRARISPDAVALRQGDRSLSYAELAGRVRSLAAALAELGVGRGDRVAYLGPNDIATFETFFASTLLGAVFAPFNTRLTGSEIGYLLEDCSPAVLIHAAALQQLVIAADPAARGVQHLVSVAEQPNSEFEDLVGSGAVGAGKIRIPDVDLADDAVILYTSGTTGRPKGAVLTHANLTFNTMNQLAHADVLSSDVALCISPLFHATGLGQVSLPTLFKGGTVVVVAGFDPAQVLALIGRIAANAFSAVPTMLQMMCDHEAFAHSELGSLRYVIYGGSPVQERVAVAWQQRGVHLQQGYGMTEASPGVYLAPVDGALERPTSIGVPHFFTDVTFDPAVPEPERGGSGELLVRGLNVFRGYWNLPEASSNAFWDGWYRTGDVARIDDDGWAFIVDRINDVIISGGENIYPSEVEQALVSLPGIREAVVVAVADQRWGEVGHAYVITDGELEGGWTADSMRTALGDRLAAFKIPKHITFVAEFSRTATGKVRRQGLRDLGGESTPPP